MVKDFKRLQIFPVPDGESEQSCGGPEAGGFWMAAIYTHTPGGKPAPGFTFVMPRRVLCAATMSQGQLAGGTGPREKVDPEESHNQLRPGETTEY